jgi:hypothetical protein
VIRRSPRRRTCSGEHHSSEEFGNPDLQALVAASGAAPQPPEITIAKAISSADEYWCHG